MDGLAVGLGWMLAVLAFIEGGDDAREWRRPVPALRVLAFTVLGLLVVWAVFGPLFAYSRGHTDGYLKATAEIADVLGGRTPAPADGPAAAPIAPARPHI